MQAQKRERTPDLYDSIGDGYGHQRRPDPRIAEMIERALGESRSVVNVGAGAGSYEPADRRTVAVEPSQRMIDQRPRDAPPSVRALAEALPFPDKAFDASLATLTVHHWSEKARGLRGLRRVARGRVVILTWDPRGPEFWLTDYFPQILELDRPVFPTMEQFEETLGPLDVSPVPVPHDCQDGFLGAYWRRPDAYLQPEVRAGMSTFSKLPDVSEGVERLRRDLASGEWHQRYGSLLELDALDLGYQLIVARVE